MEYWSAKSVKLLDYGHTCHGTFWDITAVDKFNSYNTRYICIKESCHPIQYGSQLDQHINQGQ